MVLTKFLQCRAAIGGQGAMRFAYVFLIGALAASGQTLKITLPVTLPAGTQYEPYRVSLTASGGTLPYTWSVAAGSASTLPEGTSFNEAIGAIGGTPKGSGVYTVTLQVSDFAKQTATAVVNIPINGNQNLGGCTYFPADNVWRQRIDGLPVNPLSSLWNSSYHNSRLHPDFGPSYGIPFTIVGAGQALTTITIDPNGFRNNSDFGIKSPGPSTAPIPPDAPIEGTDTSDGDRHVLTLDTSDCVLYEMYNSHFPAWMAYSTAKFDLKSNDLRPAGWTSADAAGLPMIPGLVAYDEILSGEIAHAVRMTMHTTLGAYIWPARHLASKLTGPQQPPMGARLRLKNSASVNARIARLSTTNRVIAVALQRYGAFIADNGGSGFITGVPDARWDENDITNLFFVNPNAVAVAVSQPTSADASSGQTLAFGNLAGVHVGMWVQCHTACTGIGVGGSTSANPMVSSIHGNSIELNQPLLGPVPAGTVIDFVDPDLACDAGPGFCLNDFDYVDESALQVSANSGATTPVITTAALPGAVAGTHYSATVQFTGGLPPFICSVTAGMLPSGLSLDARTCAITGDLSDWSGRAFTLTVTDSAARTGSARFSVHAGNRRGPF